MKTFLTLLFSLMLTATMFAIPVKSKVTEVSGTAVYTKPGSLFEKPLKAGMTLSSGTIIKTGGLSFVVLSITPGAAIRIDQNTIIAVSDMSFEKNGDKVSERKARIQLSAGTVSALLDDSTPEVTDFRIQTPQGTAAARGTFYGVSVVDGNTFVKVEEGKVGFQQSLDEEE